MKLKYSFGLQVIPLRLIEQDPSQPRQDFDPVKIRKLAESLRQEGLAQPGLVKPHPRIPGRFLLVAGERRYRAMLMAEVEEAPFVVTTRHHLSSYALSVVENMLREDLNPIEQALAFKRLHEQEEMPWEQIGQLSGLEVGTIKLRLGLLDLPDEIQQMIRHNQLPQMHALNLAQFRGNKAKQIELAQRIIAGENPLEIAARRTEKMRKAKKAPMDNTPEGRLRRVAAFVWRGPSSIQALQYFRTTPRDQALIAWSKFGARAQENTLRTLRNLRLEIEKIIDFLENIARPLDAKPAIPKVEPVAVAEVAIPHNGRPHAVPAPAAPAPEPLKMCEANAILAVEVLQAVFPNGFNNPPALHRARLAKVFKTRDVAKIDMMFARTLAMIEQSWRVPIPKGAPWQAEFVQQVGRLRYQSGDQTFPQFVNALRQNRAYSEPVNF